jgi:hypothetical protein
VTISSAIARSYKQTACRLLRVSAC